MGEKRVNFPYYASVIICILGLLAVSYIALRYLLWSVLPFLISWGIAFALRPLSAHLHRRTKIPRKILNFTLMLAALLLVFSILFIISDRLVTEIRGFISHVGENPSMISDTVERINDLLTSISDKLNIFGVGGGGDEGVRSYLSGLAEKATGDMISELPKTLGRVVMTVPKTLIFLLVSVIASFYFSTDLQGINEKILAIVPKKWQSRLVSIKDIIFDTTLKYLRSYLIIMLITFALLLLGFLIIGVKYYFVLSIIFALVDILPVLGVGALLVPWGIFSLATGELYRGMGLLILYAVIAVVRQVVEPKIIGVSLGIHPLLTLFSMYLGFTLFGVVGMILGPIFALILKSVLFATDRYKSIPKE